MTDEIRWFVGVDWGSTAHQVSLIDAAGRRVGQHQVAHGGAGLAALCTWLVETTGAPPGQIAIAIETTHGPVVNAFLERGFAVHALNPKQLDRFRDRFSPAGAKDDSRDADVLGHSLRTDRHAFRRLLSDDPLIVELREHAHMAEELQAERIRLANRLREQLWRYYPQMLELTDDPTAEWVLALWHLAPTPAQAHKLKQSTLERLLKTHRIRRHDAAAVLAILRQTPLVVAPGVSEAATAHIRAIAARLRLATAQLKTAHRRLDALCARLEAGGEGEAGHGCEQRDVAILRSLPGVGRIVLATLLAEAWEPLRRRDYHALRALSGVAPVTRRLACNRRLAQGVYHWARCAVRLDPLSRARYAALRRRGHRHGRALRTIGDRLLAVACTLLERGIPFDPAYPARAAA